MIKSHKYPSVSASEAGKSSRHRWYFFKEGFSPEIVNFAIEDSRLDHNAIVFDPFSGSGTTALTAGLHGLRGIGNEVNPFLRFVAQTKCLTVPVTAFDDIIEDTLDGIYKPIKSNLLNFSTFSELSDLSQKRGKWLFNSEILNSFEGGRQRISRNCSQANALAKLCLINAAMDVANAEKDGKCLRYKKNWQQTLFTKKDFINAFEKHSLIVREDLIKTEIDSLNVSINLGDSRSAPAQEKFDLCVTSPPYLNSFDYTDVYRPELFLSQYINTMEDLMKLRLTTLRSHVQVNWEPPIRNDFGENYLNSLSKIIEAKRLLEVSKEHMWCRKLPLMIQAYFEDMEKVLIGLRKRTNPDGSVWIVVSTSAYVGVEIPVDLILADIATKCGWFLREVVVLRYLKRVAAQQWNLLSRNQGNERPYLRESVIVLDAGKRR